MRKKRAIRLLGATAVVAMGTGLLSVSGLAHGLEHHALKTVPAVSVHQAQTRLHLAQADAAPASTPVSYAAEQAERGEKDFEKHCVECHGDDLKGGLNGGPPLRGLAFEQKYANGAPASAMFEFMSTLMPPNSPGRFSPGTYADLMAYILKRNGFQPGAPLPSDIDALNNLTVEK